MKWIFSLLASPALKQGFVVALRVIAIVESALQGVLRNDQVSDAARKNIESAIYAIGAVKEFMVKVGSLFGIAAYDVAAGVSAFQQIPLDYVDNLRDLTKKL
jgi:hypothetical protein